MEHKPEDPDNIIDLASQRRRQRTLSKRRDPKPRQGARSGKSKVNATSGSLTWKHYLQFFVFLGILALMLEQCRH